MLNITLQNLLPKEVYKRVALNYRLPNIKPKITEGFKRLTKYFSRITLGVFIVSYLLGYYPSLTFPPVKQSIVLADNQAQKEEIIAASFPQPVGLPHPGYISTHFSKYHPGLDIAAGLGMPIHPITKGIVDEVNYGFLGYGNNVSIIHENGFKSLYAHMGRIYVKKGQQVSVDATLGTVGLTGHTSGPHTHLEIFKDGRNIDPLTILPPLPDYPIEEAFKPVEEVVILEEPSQLHKTLKPDFS